MVQKFIERPVLSTVLSILICLIGAIGLYTLPVSQYPDIAPPMVRVSTMYAGASADVVLKSVIAPLEEQINGVEGMTYMVSTSANDGSASIEIYFEQNTNPDMAAVNVQNRVSAASSKLPSDVTRYGVTTEKVQNNMLIVLSLYSENKDYDMVFVENYARINIYPEVQRVFGVGRVNIFGANDYSMRLWLDPVKMAAHKLNPSDVMRSVQEQNVEAAPGKFGENADQQFQYTIRYKGKFTDVSEYENIVIRAEEGGQLLKLKDVAKVELGSFNYSMTAISQGCPAVGMAVYQMAGSNAQEVVKGVEEVVAELEKSLPAGLKIGVPMNTNLFLEESITKVMHTFFEAFILVFIVVYFFLQDIRSTLIPVISSLVAILGTFFFLQMFGFSINLLTLFALVLAIGMVVDDAIVVVEAVHAKMEHRKGITLNEATSSAMHEITGAIISITFVMSAVFFPVSFMTGPVGVFYRQFALTLATAMILSAINALTLSPVLCILLIKPSGSSEKSKFVERLHSAFNASFNSLTTRYSNVLSVFIKHRWIPLTALVAFGVALFFLMKNTPTGFIPNEDQGTIMVDVQLPAGSSLERTEKIMKQIDDIMVTIPEIQSRYDVSGTGLLSGGQGGSYGLGFYNLVDWGKRERTVNEVMGELYQRTAGISEANILFFSPPAVPGFGMADGFEIQFQDKTGSSVEKFDEVIKNFMGGLMQQPEIKYVTTVFDANFPQYEFEVNVDKCKMAGVNVGELFATLQGYYGSMFVSDFNRFTKYYRVMLQASPEDRKDLKSIDKIMVRNDLNEMVPVSTLVSFKRIYGTELLKRYNLFSSTAINGASNEGYSTGDAIAAIERVKATLPAGYDIEYSGMTREEVKAGNTQLLIFALCFVFVYLILCAQYESYILPLAVMIPLIIGIFGVFLFINMFGIDNNIYVQVALIMLIGLLAKNGILIVEFARQRREHGMTIKQSAIEAAVARLRPILMTSFAFIFGMIPLMVASGAGSAGNNSIGTAAAGGMLIGTVFGVFVIPVMYIIFEKIDEDIRRKKRDKIAAMYAAINEKDKEEFGANYDS